MPIATKRLIIFSWSQIVSNISWYPSPVNVFNNAISNKALMLFLINHLHTMMKM